MNELAQRVRGFLLGLNLWVFTLILVTNVILSLLLAYGLIQFFASSDVIEVGALTVLSFLASFTLNPLNSLRVVDGQRLKIGLAVNTASQTSPFGEAVSFRSPKLINQFTLLVAAGFGLSFVWAELKETVLIPLAQLTSTEVVGKTATVSIIKGKKNPDDPDNLTLRRGRAVEISLVDPNQLKFIMRTDGWLASEPELIVKDLSGGNIRHFLLQPPGAGLLGKRELVFAFTESTDVIIPQIDKTSPLLRVLVDQPPVPRVRLSVKEKRDFYSDDLPVTLEIKASSIQPIMDFRLHLSISGEQSSEVMRDFEPATLVEFLHELQLNAYMIGDYGKLTLQVEAIDSNSPPGIGFSNIIELPVLSSYGRYQKVLQGLREVKQLVDREHTEKSILAESTPEMRRQMEKVIKDSRSTPFFDRIDRMVLDEMLKSMGVQGQLTAVSRQIDEFLLEHEAIDDRERDRDFFIAARSFSRAMTLQVDNRQLVNLSNKLGDFVEERSRRWAKRVDRLQDNEKITDQWQEMAKKRPFISTLKKMARAFEVSSAKAPSDLNDQQNTRLTELSRDYQEWIDALEAAEDSFQEQQFRKKQQHAASARKELEILQKRQNQISADLDQAASREAGQLELNWPSTRSMQNENVTKTEDLEAMMRVFLPVAARRLQAATEAMKLVVDLGEKSKFPDAETGSDLASRLLRLVRQDTSNLSRRNSRRRKRASGNQYYGQTVFGGHLQLEYDYSVDKKYREDILNDSQIRLPSKEEHEILNNYLRRVVR